jgi:hypothetical protein
LSFFVELEFTGLEGVCLQLELRVAQLRLKIFNLCLEAYFAARQRLLAS